MNHFFDIIMIPIQFIIVFYTLYYFTIGFFGIWHSKEKKILTPT